MVDATRHELRQARLYDCWTPSHEAIAGMAFDEEGNILPCSRLEAQLRGMKWYTSETLTGIDKIFQGPEGEWVVLRSTASGLTRGQMKLQANIARAKAPRPRHDDGKGRGWRCVRTTGSGEPATSFVAGTDEASEAVDWTDPHHWNRKHTAEVAEALAAMPSTDVRLTSATTKEAAALLVDEEIVQKRLGGRPELLKRWKTQNAGAYKYMVGLKSQDIGSFQAQVVRVDQELAKAKAMVRMPNGNYMDATGRVHRRSAALKLGMIGDDE